MRRKLIAGVVLAVLTYPGDADADAIGVGVRHIQTPGPRKLCKLDDPPTCITLQPGRFLDEQTWGRLDLEMRRLQEAETRLTAENQYMRNAVKGWRPGWKTILTTLAVGFAGGIAAYHYAH